jgi:5-methylcytosine-specific restriction endonuclease McrA
LEKNVSKLNVAESEINTVKKRAKPLPKPKQPKIRPNTVETEISLQESIPKEKTTKKKKQNIPKNVKVLVWSNYIGENINSHRCLCCKKSIINITNFHVGHVISEKEGGTLEINNLRPICSACNSSMGSMNMIEYVKKYGLHIG